MKLTPQLRCALRESKRHVVCLSGGKDSTALALRLAEIEPRSYEYLITPTGNELPAMIEHWRRLADILQTPLTVRTMGQSLLSLIKAQGMIPNHRARWCTRVLKIQVAEQYLCAAAPATSYVGLRADEAERVGMYGQIEGVIKRYPLREWGWRKLDVWAYLAQQGVSIPARTDCALCFYQRIGEWWALWDEYPDYFRQGEAIETALGHTFRSDERDSWPASLHDLRIEFEKGKRPQHAGQLGLFDDRTGMCRACTL